jgi:two-component system sensor histidine kinase KdpD
LFLAAIALSAWYGGIGPAVIPMLGGGLAIDYFFEDPPYLWQITDVRTVVDIVSFALVGALIGLLNHRLRQANLSLMAERDRAEAAVCARDDLFAIVSHSLRTPLTTIQASIFTLRAARRLPTAKRETLLGNIASQTDRLVRFVADALALSRLENAPATHVEWNDLGEVVWAALQRCLSLLGDRPINDEIPDDLPLARFDAGLLDQALVTLFENAAIHTPAGSPVWIDGQVSETNLRLGISDARPGIPPGDRERIFDKYERLDSSGSGVGLGLAIARAAVQAQGGSIWAESGPHGGTRFVVSLPNVDGLRRAA